MFMTHTTYRVIHLVVVVSKQTNLTQITSYISNAQQKQEVNHNPRPLPSIALIGRRY